MKVKKMDRNFLLYISFSGYKEVDSPSWPDFSLPTDEMRYLMNLVD